MTSADSFNILVWMLSGPGDFDAFKDFNAVSTNSSVTLMSVSGEANCLSSICGMDDRSSRVNTEVKNWLRTSTFSCSEFVKRLSLTFKSGTRDLVFSFEF